MDRDVPGTARKPGKTDSLDARAIALLVRQEIGTLPRVLPEDQTALLDLLTTERESAVVEATRLRNQIHAHLMQIDPGYALKLPSLTSKAGLDALQSFASPGAGLLKEQRVLVVRQLAQRLRLAVLQAGELEKQIEALDRIARQRGLPKTIRCDNGPESASRVLDQWAFLNGVELDFSRPATPTDNAYIESFNARLRQDLLNASRFLSLADARDRMEAWRKEYNEKDHTQP